MKLQPHVAKDIAQNECST